MQAPRFECLSFDPFTLFQNGFVTAEVDVGGCDVVQALMVALMIVVNRPLFAGDPEVRILGYGKEQMWKQIFT